MAPEAETSRGGGVEGGRAGAILPQPFCRLIPPPWSSRRVPKVPGGRQKTKMPTGGQSPHPG